MKKLTTEAFISAAKNVHGSKYGYASTVYSTSRSLVTVTCPDHGDFSQLANNHLRGAGCPACGNSAKSESKIKGKAEVLLRISNRFGNKFGEPLVVPDRAEGKVTLVCPSHGEFTRLVKTLLNSEHGCPDCGRLDGTSKASLSRRKGAQHFLKIASEVHGSKYTYDLMSFKNMADPASITCPIHGEFMQRASDHAYKGTGCPKCIPLMSYDGFIEKSTKAHGSKYEYDRSSYSGTRGKVRIRCKSHGWFNQTANHHSNGSGCPACASGGPSKGQLEVSEFIKSLGFSTLVDVRIPGSKLELDVLVPDKSFAVEFDGAWWHSERTKTDDYHSAKLKLANSAGITLIQIFSDQWRNKKEQWKSLVAHRLGVSTRKLMARKCKVVSLNYSECSEFFNRWHIQGKSNRGDGVGLVLDGELVSAMSFSDQFSARSPRSPGVFELVRYASSAPVSGGASKLFSHFINSERSCQHVVSFSDNRAFSGGIYKRLGFVIDDHLPPDYTYVAEGTDIRLQKRLFSHARLPITLGTGYDPARTEHENALANGYYRVYDSGKIRWKWSR